MTTLAHACLRKDALIRWMRPHSHSQQTQMRKIGGINKNKQLNGRPERQHEIYIFYVLKHKYIHT